MTSVDVLLEVGPYNAVTIDPYQGVCGLSLFKNNIENPHEIRRYLSDCNQFCEVFKNIEDVNKAIDIDIVIYKGLMTLFPDKKEREEWREKIELVAKTVAQVLDSIENVENRERIKKEDIEKSINVLIEIRIVAENRLHRPEKNIFYRISK